MAKKFQQENTGMQNRITLLEDRILALENDKRDLQQRILNLESRIAAVETENLNLNTRIVLLEMNPNIRKENESSADIEILWCKAKIADQLANQTRLQEEYNNLLKESEKLWIEINELKRQK